MNKKKLTDHVSASMRMESMPLTRADKQRIALWLSGKASFQESIERLVKKHAQPNPSGK